MGGESLAQAGPTAVSLLALVLSLINLYLQRRDRRLRLEIRGPGTSTEPPPLTRLPTRTLFPRYTTTPKRGRTCCWGTSSGNTASDIPRAPRWCDSPSPTRGRKPSTWIVSGWYSAPAAARSGNGWYSIRRRIGQSPSSLPRASPTSSLK